MALFIQDMEDIKRRRLEGKVFVFNNWADYSVPVQFFPVALNLIRSGLGYAVKRVGVGWRCEDFMSNLQAEVAAAAQKRFGDRAKLKKWTFYPTGYRDRVVEKNHILWRLILDDGTEKGVDFWDHWRYDVFQAPAIVRDWTIFHKQWKDELEAPWFGGFGEGEI
jgi:hypothetical protein